MSINAINILLINSTGMHVPEILVTFEQLVAKDS